MLRALLLSIGQLGDPPIIARVRQVAGGHAAALRRAGRRPVVGLRMLSQRWVGDGDDAAWPRRPRRCCWSSALWLLFRASRSRWSGVFARRGRRRGRGAPLSRRAASARPVPFRRGAARWGWLGRARRRRQPADAADLCRAAGHRRRHRRRVLPRQWLAARARSGRHGRGRHMDAAAMRGWRAATGAQRFLLGLAAPGCSWFRSSTCVAPVLGAAMATHLFHARRGSGMKRLVAA